MIETHTLTEEDPVELLEGVLVFKRPKSPLHEAVVSNLADLLADHLPAGSSRRAQGSVTLFDGEPEPDLAVFRGTLRDYVHRHPAPLDLALVIEVSDSTLTRDRTLKLRSFARAAIPTYGIINLEARVIETFLTPDVASAANPNRQTYRANASVPLPLGGTIVAHLSVDQILPP